MLSILVEAQEKIVGDATLHRRLSGWLQHVGETRVVVDPEYRRRRLCSLLVEELILLAIDAKIERLFAELIASEIAAVRMFEWVGFERVAQLPGFARDRINTPQDLLVLSADISTTDGGSRRPRQTRSSGLGRDVHDGNAMREVKPC